jgi:hypothetical protein
LHFRAFWVSSKLQNTSPRIPLAPYPIVLIYSSGRNTCYLNVLMKKLLLDNVKSNLKNQVIGTLTPPPPPPPPPATWKKNMWKAHDEGVELVYLQTPTEKTTYTHLFTMFYSSLGTGLLIFILSFRSLYHKHIAVQNYQNVLQNTASLIPYIYNCFSHAFLKNEDSLEEGTPHYRPRLSFIWL